MPVQEESLNLSAEQAASAPYDEQNLETEGEFSDDATLPEAIDRPFDPLQIKISRRVVPISLVVQRIDYQEVELAPDFQRRARIWDIGRKSRLIESILLRIPLPVFYVAADAIENWRVVDGLQRLTTIYDFVSINSENNFSLAGLEYLKAYEGASYDRLPRSIKRRIDETELNVNVIESGTPDEVMFNVFKRINTGGISLNGQEIRHALNPGNSREFLLELASSREFLEATDRSVNDDRMGARELVLRFLAFKMTSPSEYRGSDLDGFLNDAMKSLNTIDSARHRELKQSFSLAMIRARGLFGNDAFRKRVDVKASRSPVNRALFEAWSVGLSKLTYDEYQTLKMRSDNLKEAFRIELITNPYFLSSVSTSTGDRGRVQQRFSTVERLIVECLH